MTTTALRTAEAIELAHALVAEMASSEPVRVMFIKGPSFSWWGLRPPRTPADVDVLVEPAGLADLVAALGRVGWHERTVTMPVTPVRGHSVTLVHPLWPCDLDLHSFFPGIFVDDDVAFDLIWSTRARMPIAGIAVEVPSRAVSACILALHALRSPSERTAGELTDLVATVRDEFTPDETRAVKEAVVALRAAETLSPFLADVGIEVDADRLTVDERRAWELMRTSDQTTLWIAALGAAPWRSRPRLLWTALTYVDPADPDHGEPRTRARWRYRIRRLGRGLRSAVT